MRPGCRKVSKLVDAYLDSELEPSQVIEVDRHLQDCADCAEAIALDRAVRAGVRRSVRMTRAPMDLRQRMAAAMEAEASRSSRPGDTMVEAGKMLPWHVVLPLASAAAVPLVLGMAGAFGDQAPRKPSVAAEASRPEAQSASVFDLDRMLDQFVDWHARPLPPEVTNETELVKFEPYVGVPMRAPALAPFGGRLVGGRMLTTGATSQTTAMLYYTLPSGHRVSVYVYDPSRVPARPTRLQQRTLGRDEVWVGKVRGYSVAAPMRHDVGYAIATDLDEEQTTRLAVAAAP